MRKLASFIVAAVCLVSCKEKPDFVLQAELQDYPADEILVVYDDPVSKLDTIRKEEGKFTYTFIPDTLTLFRLVSPDGQIIPVFADKAQHVSITGTFTDPLIKGTGANSEYSEFLKSTESLKNDTAALAAKAEEFIRSHTQSFVSAYLIDRYFVQVPYPDIEKVRSLIDPLRGNIKDSRILGMALKSIPPKKKTEREDKYLAYFSCKDRNGKYISWNSSEKDSYTLLNFWASWDQSSLSVRDSLAKLTKELPEAKFKVLNISLDYEKDKWLRTCKDDSKQWIEVCDYKGWGNQVIKQNDIHKLPANILIDRNRKIMARDIYGEELRKLTKELTGKPKK